MVFLFGAVKTVGAGALTRASDKKREVLIAFFERTPPGTHVRGSHTKLSKIDAVAFNARQRPDLLSCPLQEPSLHFDCQGFENWRLFFGKVFFSLLTPVCFISSGIIFYRQCNCTLYYYSNCMYVCACVCITAGPIIKLRDQTGSRSRLRPSRHHDRFAISSQPQQNGSLTPSRLRRACAHCCAAQD